MFFLAQHCHSVGLFTIGPIRSGNSSLGTGMAKAGPDVTGENQGGFASDNSPINGFSHMHDSGTGGVSCSCATPDALMLTAAGRFPGELPNLSPSWLSKQ